MLNVNEIEKAIAAHSVWKMRLKRVIATGASSLSAERVQADSGCDFGRWIHSDASLAPGRAGAMRAEVLRLHAAFHKEAAKVVSLALAGRKAEAEQHMSLSGDFTVASSNLTVAMMEWKKNLI